MAARTLTYATVCSGVECMGAAVADLPMRPVFFSEIEPFPCAVLKFRYPDVPNLGDMGRIRVVNDGKEITNGRTTVALPDGGLDVFAGGTPCQDVSAAGLRRGMAEGSGTRSSLAFEFARLVGELRPRWVVWENVAGVLSDPNFPGFLSALAERGYGVAYRTLDAQWVRCADIHHADGGVVRLERAVPQRRRRVWVVGRLGGDVGEACEVLFEREGLAGDNPPRRKPGQGAARPSADGDGMAARMVGAAAIAGNVIGRSDGCGGNGVGAAEELAYTLDTVGGQGVAAKVSGCLNPDAPQSKRVFSDVGAIQTLSARPERTGDCTPFVLTGAAGFDPYEPGGVKSVNDGLAGTVVNGTCPGRHNAVVRTFENHAADSRLAPIVVAPTMGASRHANASSDNPLVAVAFENHAQDARVRPCGDSSPTIGASNLNGPSCNNPLVVTEGTCA